MTLLQDLEQRAGRLSESQRATLAARLLSSLPPVLVDADDGVAEAARRDVEMDADLSLGMSEKEFRSSIAASRKR
jgi:hypothetical protein